MVIIVLKKCVICGKEFDAIRKYVTCSEECSKKNKKLTESKYNAEYYIKNWTKWQYYRKNTEKDKTGTGDLGEKMHRDKDGDIDFEGEMRLVKKEMVRLGMRYPK